MTDQNATVNVHDGPRIDPKPELGIFHDDDGDLSMMRVLAFVGVLLACVLVVVGLGLSVYEEIHPHGSMTGLGLCTLGFGTFTSGAIGKAWQKQAEVGGRV